MQRVCPRSQPHPSRPPIINQEPNCAQRRVLQLACLASSRPDLKPVFAQGEPVGNTISACSIAAAPPYRLADDPDTEVLTTLLSGPNPFVSKIFAIFGGRGGHRSCLPSSGSTVRCRRVSTALLSRLYFFWLGTKSSITALRSNSAGNSPCASRKS